MKLRERFNIVNSVLRFELAKGHLRWKVTDIARVSGVNRGIIYYNFGRTKGQIFDTCLDVISSEFYGTSEERMKFIERGDLYGCVFQNFKMFRESPEFLVFYSNARVKKSPLRDRLIAIEENYREKLSQIFPHLSSEEILAVHAVIQGAVSSPILCEETFEIAMKRIIGPFAARPRARKPSLEL